MRTMQRGARRRDRRGFTLLEVLLVVAILVMLAVMIVPNFVGVRQQAQIDLTRTQIRGAFKKALKIYNMHVGQFPTTEEGLQTLVKKPEDEAMGKKWHGPYLDADDINDAWGEAYQYRCPGEHNETSYDLWSKGPDKEDGTDDDITNWTVEGSEGGTEGGPSEAPAGPAAPSGPAGP